MTLRPPMRRRRAARPALIAPALPTPLAAAAVLAAVVAALVLPLPAQAQPQVQDIAWSGFATLGHTRSDDAPGRYLRWIDDQGTFNADSVAALQADWRLSPRWSATVQLKAAPSESSDSQWRLRPAWAFLGWRPADAWLVRAGRMRLPLYMYSESMDVGVAQDMARLPVEMYSIAPSNDYNGLSVSHSRSSGLLPDGELSLEAYTGRIGATARLWLRDGAPPLVPAGPRYVPVKVGTTGLVATLRNPGTTLRLGLHVANTSQRDGTRTPVDFPFVAIGPGLGYYKVDDNLPGPPLQTVPRIRNLITTLGIEQQLGGGWRVAAELARNHQLRTRIGSDTLGGYATLFRDIGAYTPYVSLGQLRTGSGQQQRYRDLMAVALPTVIPGAAQINASQRIAAESIYLADQTTWALGLTWHLPWGGSLKLERASTRIGKATRLVDAPAGQPTPHDDRFATWRLNYSVAY